MFSEDLRRKSSDPQPTAALALSNWLWWLPRAAIALFLMAVAALLWLSYRSDIDEQRATLISDVLWLEQDLHFNLLRNEEQLQQLALDLPSPQIPPKVISASQSDTRPRAFELRARYLLENQTGLRQMLWLDAAGSTRASLPAPLSEALTVGEATPSVPSQETLRLSRALAKPAYSPAYAIVLDDAQFEVHVPQYHNGQYAGMIVGVYSVRRILDDLVPWWLAERYRVSIADESGVLGSKSVVAAVNSQMSYQIPFSPPDHGLMLRAEAYEIKIPLARNLFLLAVVLLAGTMLWSLWALRRHIQRRIAAEQALRKEYAFRTAMEDSLATGLRARDLDGRIIYVNPAFCRMVGYSVSELVGQSPPMPYWDSNNLEVTEKLNTRILSGEAPSQGYETTLRHKSGHVVHTMVHTAPLIDSDGRHFGWLSSVLDITEAKRLETLARQQEEKLQFTARLVAMGEMASSLAHELNQPLAAISSYSTGCLNRIEQSDILQSELVEALQKIGRQAQRAGAVIRRIYEFVRRSEPQQARCDLGSIIVDASGLLEGEARKRGIRVQLQVPANLPQVVADSLLLEQVLVNLIKNGIEAMQTTLEEERILEVIASCNGNCTDGQISIVIKDHGCGIAEEDVSKIFLPFFTTKPEGMGMGLNICRSIIESHRGRLWYEANPDGGSIFNLTLPIHAESST